MKKMIQLFIMVSSLFVFAACSATPSIELIDANVQFVNDKEYVGSIGITEGERKGEELVPTALYYEFILKNTSNKTIGGETEAEGIHVEIVPKDKLKTVSEEVVSFNVFDPNAYDKSGVGYGETSVWILPPDEDGMYHFHFDVGVSEENKTVPLMVPADEELERLLTHALDAHLVVTIEDEEIAKFDLADFK